MRFTGRVDFRSSLPSAVGAGPPGETEIQRLNPSRLERILRTIGWEMLEPGSLNLDVEIATVEGLAALQPVLEESSTDIVYPLPYGDIPRIRKGYRYYRGVLREDTATEPVLIRCALAPPEVRWGSAPPRFRIELFAATSLKAKFNLNRHDLVEVEAQ